MLEEYLKQKKKLTTTHEISAAEYDSIHQWLVYHYGKASKCEGESCKGITNYFQWALKKGYKYAKNREHFMELCRSCHSRLDFTEETRKKMSQRMKGRFPKKNGTIVCRNCPTVVEKPSSSQIYCSDCGIKIRKKQRADWAKIQRKEHPEYFHAYYLKYKNN